MFHACSNLKEIVKHLKITSVNWQTFDFKIFFFFSLNLNAVYSNTQKKNKFQYFFPSKSLNIYCGFVWEEEVKDWQNRVVFLTNCRIMRRCNFYFQWYNRDSIRRKMDSIDSWFQLSIFEHHFLMFDQENQSYIVQFPIIQLIF